MCIFVQFLFPFVLMFFFTFSPEMCVIFVWLIQAYSYRMNVEAKTKKIKKKKTNIKKSLSVAVNRPQKCIYIWRKRNFSVITAATQ